MSKMLCACVSSNYHVLSTGMFTHSAVVLAVSTVAGAMILITALLHYFRKSYLEPRLSIRSIARLLIRFRILP